jgi:ABC-type transport system substrate-binding protein
MAETGDNTVVAAVKQMLVEVGIDWQVDILERTAWTSRHQNLDYDLTLYRTLVFDPDMLVNFLYYPGGNFNRGRSHNEKAIQLIEASGIEPDWKKRRGIYNKLLTALYDNYEDAWLWYDLSIVAYSKNVQGWNNDMNKKYRSLFSASHPLWFKDGKR